VFRKAQRIVALAITMALRTSPNDLVDAHAGLFPIDLALSKVCHGALARWLSLPDTHLLYKVIKEARCMMPKKHMGPIDRLLNAFKVGKKKYETITPIKALAAVKPDFKVTIAKSRASSIMAEKNDKADFKIFTDGSGQRGKIGAAAVMYKKGKPPQSTQSR